MAKAETKTKKTREVYVQRQDGRAKNGWVRNETTGEFVDGEIVSTTRSGNQRLVYVLEEGNTYTVYENWYGKVKREKVTV